MLSFTAVRVLIVETQAPEAPREYATLSARQLTDLYRAARGSVEQRRIADAVNALHLVHGEQIVRWLDEEQEYEERVAMDCPFLGEDHRRWLLLVRAEIEQSLVDVDGGDQAGRQQPGGERVQPAQIGHSTMDGALHVLGAEGIHRG